MLYFFLFFRMKIVKEHNEMASRLEERKKSLQVQLEMVWILKLRNYRAKRTKAIFISSVVLHISPLHEQCECARQGGILFKIANHSR